MNELTEEDAVLAFAKAWNHLEPEGFLTLLAPGARAPVAVQSRGKQVCTCFNVTDVAINEQLGNCTGNEAERRYRTISHYRITVRLDDGTRRVIEQQSAPAWHEGDAVRIRNGEIVPRQAQGSGSQQPANF